MAIKGLRAVQLSVLYLLIYIQNTKTMEGAVNCGVGKWWWGGTGEELGNKVNLQTIVFVHLVRRVPNVKSIV